MSRLDLVKLRKRAGMSQKELADLLQVRASFLSAIENGKSRLPEEKLEKIKEIFELESFDDYLVGDETEVVPPHTHVTDPTDTITQLLIHFHELAHQRDKAHGNHDTETEERIDFLTHRNDRLSERVDNLRDEVDRLRLENLALKELLLRNGISYTEDHQL